jgi:hypothetical protein
LNSGKVFVYVKRRIDVPLSDELSDHASKCTPCLTFELGPADGQERQSAAELPIQPTAQTP